MKTKNNKTNVLISVTVLTLFFSILISCSSIDYFDRSITSKETLNKKSDKISLLTYNIKAIYEKEENEINNLVSFVNNEEMDFVVFQELFDESTRAKIIEKADSSFITFISRVDYNSFPEFIFQDAGLFMMSRYQRIDLSTIDFGDDINNCNGVIYRILEKEYSRTNDFLANKSVLGSLFTIDDSTYLFLFTAHVQAAGSSEHKEFQLGQINKFISTAIKNVIDNKLVKDVQNLVVLLAGDFNSNAYDNNRFARFQKLLGYPRDLHKDFHGDFEEYTFRNRTRRYDYVLAYDKIDDTVLRRVEVKSINVENILNDNGEGISDHLGIKAILSLEKKLHSK